MRIRYCLPALSMLTVFAAPAAAQNTIFVEGTGQPSARYDDAGDRQPNFDNEDAGFSAIADNIGNPSVQAGVSAAIERAADAMMNMPIGPMADAIERARPGTVGRRIHPDSTVADIAGRDSRYLPQELGERSREAMGMMSGFARIMATMMPEFERMGHEMEESFRAAKAEARRDGY